MKRSPLILLLGLITLLIVTNELELFAGKTKQKEEKKGTSKVVAKVGDEQITFEQVEKSFQKNMNRKTKFADLSKDSILDFINMYVKYRLKVNDALSRGLDKDSSIKAEIEQNRKILAENFLYEKLLLDPNVDLMVKRREKDYKIAVIICAHGPLGDTTQSSKKIQEALDKLNNGETFESIATKYSEDSESAKNGGVVRGFISSGMVNRNLENPIYSLKINEYTKTPIKTNFAYFVIKVLDIQPRMKSKVGHILINTELANDSVAAWNKANQIYERLKNGADFSQLAKENSDEKQSAEKGGWFGFYSKSTGLEKTRDHLSADFEQNLYQIKDKQYTKPFLTQFGIHIATMDSTQMIDPNSEREELKLIYKRMYYNEDKKTLFDSLSRVSGLNINQLAFNEFAASMDSNKTNLDSNWTKGVSNGLKEQNLFGLLNKKWSVQDFINLMNTKSELRGYATNNEGLKKAIDKIAEPTVLAEATKNLENDYPEFASTVKEFRDGILLFKVEATEVWDKLKFDSTEARKYYDQNSDKLIRDKMIEFSEIYLLSDSTAQKLYKQIQNKEIEFEKAAENLTQRAEYRKKKGDHGLQSIKRSRLAAAIDSLGFKAGEISKPFQFEKGFSIIKVKKIEEPRKKTFEEAIPDIAPKVQDLLQKRLTDSWLENVKKRFPVTINEKVVNEYIKKK